MVSKGMILHTHLYIRMGHGQGPEEPAQPLYVPALLQGLAHCRHLHSVWCVKCEVCSVHYKST